MNFDSRFLGMATAVFITLKLAVPNFTVPWIWVLSPLWGVAGFVCAVGLLGALMGSSPDSKPAKTRR